MTLRQAIVYAIDTGASRKHLVQSLSDSLYWNHTTLIPNTTAEEVEAEIDRMIADDTIVEDLVDRYLIVTREMPHTAERIREKNRAQLKNTKTRK